MKIMKKLLAICFALALVIGIGNVTAFAAVSGDGTDSNPYICETVEDVVGTVTIPAGETYFYYAPIGAMTLTVEDSTTAVQIVSPRGTTMALNEGGIATYTFSYDNLGDVVMFGLQNQNPRAAATATVTVGLPEVGSQGNPQVVEPNTNLAGLYVMNIKEIDGTALEAGDQDGRWYSVTATKDGVFYLDVTNSGTEEVAVKVYTENGGQHTLDDGNPIITYKVTAGEKILINVYAADWMNCPAINNVYISGKVVDGEKEAVSVKTFPLSVPVTSGETVYIISGDRNYTGTEGIIISGYSEAIALAEVTVAGVVYTDTDGDGTIEFVPGGSNMGRPAIAITNNHDWDINFTVTMVETAREGYFEPETDHELTHVEAVEAGCHMNGMSEYWYCEECDVYYSNAECTEPITNYKNLTILATGGVVTHVEAVAPTCSDKGNIEYWYCETCELVWQDEALTQITNHKNVILPAGCQNIVHVEAVAPTCTTNGNVEYWYCAECGQVWTNEALTQLSNIKNVILPATGGKVVHVPAKAPTATENGNIEHWYCEDCETVWQDAALTQITNHKNVILPKAPKTGEMNVVLWVAIVGIASVAVAGSAVMRKKEF